MWPRAVGGSTSRRAPSTWLISAMMSPFAVTGTHVHITDAGAVAAVSRRKPSDPSVGCIVCVEVGRRGTGGASFGRAAHCRRIGALDGLGSHHIA
eukprot:scaffold3679_cov116-Isochrysis_galbana.AAC.2